MLVLSRKMGESIIIDGNIKVTVVGIEDNQIRLGIDAPREIEILREELYLSVQNSNKEASESKINLNKIENKEKEKGLSWEDSKAVTK